MPKKNEKPGLRERFKLPVVRTGPAVATVAALVITMVVILAVNGRPSFDVNEFEVGKVAEGDVIAPESLSVIDTDATRAQAAAQLRQVPAVWKYDVPLSDEIRKTFDHFVLFSQRSFAEENSSSAYARRINEEFPGAFDQNVLAALYQDPNREISLEAGRRELEFFLEKGIFALPEKAEEGELAAYHSDTADLLHNYSDRVGRERINYSQITTMNNLDIDIFRYIREEALSGVFSAGAGSIVRSLLKPNVFFSPSDTEQRAAEALSRLVPVYRFIERGDRIIRRGFIITETEMENLQALNVLLTKRDPRLIAGQMLLILVIFLFLVFHMGKRIAGRILRPSECYMMTVLTAAYLVGASLAGRFIELSGNVPVSILLPTALAVMLPCILLGFPMALITAMVLPLGAFLTESFNVYSYFFALCSGVTAAHVLKSAQMRMDLVKAGLLIAAANVVAAIIVLLLHQASAVEYPRMIFWAAFNGVVSALLVIGILPVMEHLLNAVTPFRLIELSDLNSPILKRLFNTAPGTYSHSIMVANLAETACQEIGANALLARVGAYYHDIGKMEQPAYFVENQTSYNKHTDISPRLSATVIRSHVKLGMEKAHALGLPEAVIDFIAEHHGNSVITWFYNDALKKEGSVNVEDFTYPGRPPRSKESAVVMLADITEAATRVLKKPTTARLEKFIQELFNGKVDHGQLSQSDLTFRELEIIKQAFIKVLISHYHSRIEYPKIHEQN